MVTLKSDATRANQSKQIENRCLQMHSVQHTLYIGQAELSRSNVSTSSELSLLHQLWELWAPFPSP